MATKQNLSNTGTRRALQRSTQPLRLKDIQDLVAKNLGTAVLRSAKDDGHWSKDQCEAARLYVRSLVYGEGDDTLIAIGLPKRVRKMIQYKFALTCWFKRDLIGQHQLHGFNAGWFPEQMANAQQRYPARPSA